MTNWCSSCKRDFGSITAFDLHRLGRHPQKGPTEWLDRIRAGLVDPLEDWRPAARYGRRCLEDDELEARGFTRNTRGAWSLARDLSRYENAGLPREGVEDEQPDLTPEGDTATAWAETLRRLAQIAETRRMSSLPRSR